MHSVCVTCGSQYSDSPSPPDRCRICDEERQYVGWDGQQWTTLDDLAASHRNTIREPEPGVRWIETEPKFGIGQGCFLLAGPGGNILWDCIALLDEPTIAEIRRLGGVSAIAISHPHYYTTMVEWSRAFDAPILLHEDDREWVCRPDPAIRFWSGETKVIAEGMTLIRGGGHFAGYQTLHWSAAAGGRGALFAGDQPQVCMDRRWTAFLYSYPNMIPLGAQAVRRIAASLEPFEFDRLYGAFGRHVLGDAKNAVRRSAERTLRFLAS